MEPRTRTHLVLSIPRTLPTDTAIPIRNKKPTSLSPADISKQAQTSLVPIVRRMQRRFGLRKVTIVADRGMISAPTIAALESRELDCDYILGARMRSTAEVSDLVLQDRGRFREIQPERQYAKDPSPLKVKEALVGERRYIVWLNEEQRRKDAADQEAIVAQ